MDTISENKRGPWSKDEKQFIADNAAKMGYKEIAATLQRNPEAVKKYVIENHASSFTESAKSAEYDIQKSPIWNDIKQQFTPDELRMFLYHWGRIVSQFRDDVYPTEEMQVVDTIKLEILMNRAVTQQRKVQQDIEALEALLATERANIERDHEAINGLEHQISVLRAAQINLNSDYQDLLKEKNKILKEMKATRDARIKQIESNKHNFVRFMRDIVENGAMRRRLGIEMEKMRLAADVEFERLSEWHEYEDGEVDQPILTPDNVLED
jgi:hypothetical protein